MTTQIARKGQQHLAHAFGLLGRAAVGSVRCGLASRRAGAARVPTCGGFQCQIGKVVAIKGLGDDLVGLVQVVAGRPNSWPPVWPGTADGIAGWRHPHRRGQTFSPVSSVSQDNRGSAKARARQGHRPAQARPRRGSQHRCRGWVVTRDRFFGAGRPSRSAQRPIQARLPRRNRRTASPPGPAISVGAWPIPANSTSRRRPAQGHLLRRRNRQANQIEHPRSNVCGVMASNTATAGPRLARLIQGRGRGNGNGNGRVVMQRTRSEPSAWA